MDDITARELLAFISKNLQMPHFGLYPPEDAHRMATVNALRLIDKIAEMRGLDYETNGKEFNQIIETFEHGEEKS